MSDVKLNATFEAFRRREQKGVLTMMSAAFFLIAVILLGAFVWANFNAFGQVAGWYAQMIQLAAQGAAAGVPPVTPTPPQAFLQLVPGYFLLLFAFFVLFAAYEAGALRWMIRGETDGILGLSLGADTWRVYSGYWVWFGLAIGFEIAAFIVAGIIAGVSAASGDVSLTGIVTGLLVLVIMCAGLYFSVRLAPAAATSVAQQKFSFFKAWSVTRGRFWAMFGSYVLLFVLYFVGTIVLYIVFFVALAGAMAPMIAQPGVAQDPAQMMSAFGSVMTSPTGIVAIIAIYGLYIALATALYLGFFGVSARAVLAAREDGKLPS